MPDVEWTPALIEDAAVRLFFEQKLNWSDVVRQIAELYPSAPPEVLEEVRTALTQRIHAADQEALTDKKMDQLAPMFVDSTDPSDHKCQYCRFFLANENKCSIVQGPISGDKGSCDYWSHEEGSDAEPATAQMDYGTAGYVETPTPDMPINCGTCQFFEDGFCKLWSGKVKAEQCCAAYSNDEVTMPQPSLPEQALDTEADSYAQMPKDESNPQNEQFGNSISGKKATGGTPVEYWDKAMLSLRNASNWLDKLTRTFAGARGMADSVKVVMNQLGAIYPEESLTEAAATSTCESCGKPFPMELVDSTVSVGNGSRTDTALRRYCPKCREEFLNEMRKDRGN